MNQVAEQDTDSARQSFQLLADRTVALQESNLRLTQCFFQRMSGITLEGKLYISEQERERAFSREEDLVWFSEAPHGSDRGQALLVIWEGSPRSMAAKQ
jgi:hypothetical protein